MKLKGVPDPVWYMAGLAVVGFVAYRLLKKGAAAVNPASQDNVINQAVTGGGSWSPGSELYNAANEALSWLGLADDEDDLAAPTTATATVTRTPFGNPPASGEHRSSRPIATPVER